MKFFRSNVTHQKLRTRENVTGVKTGEKHPKKVKNLNENHMIRFSIHENNYAEVSIVYLQPTIMRNFVFCARKKKSRMRVYLSFFPGLIKLNRYSKKIGLGLIQAEIKVVVYFLRSKKIGRQQASLQRPIFPKDIRSKF